MHADKERIYFERGREVLGKRAGGLLTTLLKNKHQDIDGALAVLEMAATKADPREWMAQACRQNGRPPPIVAGSVREKLAASINGRFYARMDSKQWLAWDKYLKAQGKVGAIRDRDGGWWFATEWPPESRPLKLEMPPPAELPDDQIPF